MVAQPPLQMVVSPRPSIQVVVSGGQGSGWAITAADNSKNKTATRQVKKNFIFFSLSSVAPFLQAT
jgi:hypothetical protein